MNIDNDRKEFQAFFTKLGRKPHVLLNPMAFAELQGIFMEVFAIVEGVKKFQFPKDLWSGKFKDPFKAIREKARDFDKEYLS